MANFKTHLTVASIGSSMAATMLFASAVASPQEVVLYVILGVVGGLLPDIDSDSSLTVRLLFTFVATFISFLVMFKQRADNTVMELFILWAASFIFIKFFVFSLFTKLTVHRGIIHSIPAAVAFGCMATIVLNRVFHFNDFVSWMGGGFVFSGSILHLILDELYSIDFARFKVKASLGSALKLGSIKKMKETIAVYMLIALLFVAMPSPTRFFSVIFAPQTYKHLEFFPSGKWFSGLYAEIKKIDIRKWDKKHDYRSTQGDQVGGEPGMHDPGRRGGDG
ncbi:metal-dependent hydrolase [Desulfobacter latus]|uniref:Metal-dependent hydrolase n=1 Tax=Desulfobacter latus TaxID=2292 RepID=A0A850SZR0_9BACT|nr:metal-dependent hydrolase [Desulfobacter latus]NWH05600.1 metal-dependent hydrolase [Desulfobacter latus]